MAKDGAEEVAQEKMKEENLVVEKFEKELIEKGQREW